MTLVTLQMSVSKKEEKAALSTTLRHVSSLNPLLRHHEEFEMGNNCHRDTAAPALLPVFPDTIRQYLAFALKKRKKRMLIQQKLMLAGTNSLLSECSVPAEF